MGGQGGHIGGTRGSMVWESLVISQPFSRKSHWGDKGVTLGGQGGVTLGDKDGGAHGMGITIPERTVPQHGIRNHP